MEQLVPRESGASWVVGTGLEGVSVVLVVCSVASWLRLAALSGAEQEVRPSSINTLTMTWQSRWVFRGVERVWAVCGVS